VRNRSEKGTASLACGAHSVIVIRGRLSRQRGLSQFQEVAKKESTNETTTNVAEAQASYSKKGANDHSCRLAIVRGPGNCIGGGQADTKRNTNVDGTRFGKGETSYLGKKVGGPG